MRKVRDPDEWRAFADPAWEIYDHDLVGGTSASGWEASVWILHAMYENAEIPPSLSHDDVERIERAAEGKQLRQFDGTIDSLDNLGTLVGSAVGASASPGRDWKRLMWAELAERLGCDLPPPEFPTYATFSLGSWPASIQPPATGSLDLEQFERLLRHLSDHSAGGEETECIWWYSWLHVLRMPPEALVYRGRLREGRELYRDVGGAGSPNNFWPFDRSWFAWTDYDYMATEVSGSRELIDALLSDPELEVLELDADEGKTAVSDTA